MRYGILLFPLLACGSTRTPPARESSGNVSWLRYQVDVASRDSRDLVDSFERSARASGCSTERIAGEAIGLAGGGRVRVSAGVMANCAGGTVALVALTYTRVLVACAEPTTREQCDAHLAKISSAQ
jgi:hypothetical protein